MEDASSTAATLGSPAPPGRSPEAAAAAAAAAAARRALLALVPAPLATPAPFADALRALAGDARAEASARLVDLAEAVGAGAGARARPAAARDAALLAALAAELAPADARALAAAGRLAAAVAGEGGEHLGFAAAALAAAGADTRDVEARLRAALGAFFAEAAFEAYEAAAARAGGGGTAGGGGAAGGGAAGASAAVEGAAATVGKSAAATAGVSAAGGAGESAAGGAGESGAGGAGMSAAGGTGVSVGGGYAADASSGGGPSAAEASGGGAAEAGGGGSGGGAGGGASLAAPASPAPAAPAPATPAPATPAAPKRAAPAGASPALAALLALDGDAPAGSLRAVRWGRVAPAGLTVAEAARALPGARAPAGVVAVFAPAAGSVEAALALAAEGEWARVGSWNIRASNITYHGTPGCLRKKVAALAALARGEGWSAFCLQEAHRAHVGVLLAEAAKHEALRAFSWAALPVGAADEAAVFAFDDARWALARGSPRAFGGAAGTGTPAAPFARAPALALLLDARGGARALALVSVHLKSVKLEQTRAEARALGAAVAPWVDGEAAAAGVARADLVVAFAGDFNLAPPGGRADAVTAPGAAWDELAAAGFAPALAGGDTNVFELNAGGGGAGHAYDNAAVRGARWAGAPRADVVPWPALAATRAAAEDAGAALRAGVGAEHAEYFVSTLRKGLQADFFKSHSDHKALTLVVPYAGGAEEDGAREGGARGGGEAPPHTPTLAPPPAPPAAPSPPPAETPTPAAPSPPPAETPPPGATPERLSFEGADSDRASPE